MPSLPRCRALALGLAAALGAAGWAAPREGSGPAPGTPAEVFGLPVTGGAAPGYVPDQACATCHQQLAEGYQTMGMARSFYRPFAQPVIERTGAFHHSASGRTYAMEITEDRYTFRRYLVDEAGARTHEVTLEVDWIVGSGNRSRVYLVQVPSGEMIQLPLAWYSQEGGRWGMSPGFEGAVHKGLTRTVRRECMFCHNAYPDVPARLDRRDAPHVFPEDLPQGIGCQRCHGPGAEHVRRTMLGASDGDLAIVNPADLDPELQRDTCYQCHMQPSVALFGTRLFHRGTFSFRPGERLRDYAPTLDVVEAEVPADQRFEINHHPYRLEQSPCFVESQGGLSCTDCHDPHRKPDAATMAAQVRRTCLGCHSLGPEGPHPADFEGACASCHMPARRPRDVVEVTMTDHRIQRPSPAATRLAPIEEHEPAIVDVTFRDPADAPEVTTAQVLRAVTVLREVRTHRGALGYLAAAERSGAEAFAHPEANLALLEGLVSTRQRKAAAALADRLLAKFPGDAEVALAAAAAIGASGATTRALALLDAHVGGEVRRVRAEFNRGLLRLARGEVAAAREHLEEAVRLHPLFAGAWSYLARAREATGDAGGAAEARAQAASLAPPAVVRPPGPPQPEPPLDPGAPSHDGRQPGAAPQR